MGRHILAGFAVASTIIMKTYQPNSSSDKLASALLRYGSYGMRSNSNSRSSAFVLGVLPKYLKYGIITISEFIKMRYDVLLKDSYHFYLYSRI